MSFGEIYTSLQTGVIDGLEHDPPTILQFKFYEVAKNLTMTQHIFDPVAPIVSTVALGRLSATGAAGRARGMPRRPPFAPSARKPPAPRQQALEVLKQNGVKTIDIDRAALATEVKPLWTSFTDQYPDTKPVVEAILKERGSPG